MSLLTTVILLLLFALTLYMVFRYIIGFYMSSRLDKKLSSSKKCHDQHDIQVKGHTTQNTEEHDNQLDDGYDSE